MKAPSRILYRVCRTADCGSPGDVLTMTSGSPAWRSPTGGNAQVLMCYASSMESAKRQWIDEFKPDAVVDKRYHVDPDKYGQYYLSAFPATFEETCRHTLAEKAK